MKKLYILFKLILFTGYVFSQNTYNATYNLKKHNQNTGLLAQTVNSVILNHSNNLILGTNNGIFLYNGKKYSRPKYHSQIISKRIDAIIKCNEHSYILLGGSPNMIYFITENKISKKISIPGERNITQLVQFSSDFNYIYIKEKGTIKKKHVNSNDRFQDVISTSEPIISFKIDKYGGIYYWNNKSLIYHFNNNDKVVCRPEKPDLIWHYYENLNDTMVVWTQYKIFFMVNGHIKKEIDHETTSNLVVRQSFENKNNQIWFCTQAQELFVLTENNVSNVYNSFPINEYAITSVFIDKNNTYWFGTVGHGLLELKKTLVEKINSSDKFKITSIESSTNLTLLGTNNGVFKYSNKTIERLKINDNITDDVNDILNNNYTHQVAFLNDTWLISTMRTSAKLFKIVRFSIEKEHFISMNSPSMGIYKNFLINGFWGSFSYRNIDNVENKKYQFKNNNRIGRVNKIIVKNDLPFILSDYCVYVLKKLENSNFDTVPILQKHALGIDCIYKDMIFNQYQCFIATSNGVFMTQFLNDNLSFGTFTQLSFSESNCIYFENNTLWIGTIDGLYKYSDNKLSKIGSNDDLINNDILSLNKNKKTNELLIGTATGLFSIHPKTEKDLDKHFSLDFYTIEFENSIDTNCSFKKIAFNKNNFKLVTNFTNFLTNTTRLFYTINNSEPFSTIEDKVEFTSLEPGDYIIKFWGENENGQKTKEQQLLINISPPFFKRTSVLLITPILLLLSSYMVNQKRIKRIKDRALVERKNQTYITELEKKALNLSLNPHFIFNSLNSIQSHISKYKDEIMINYISDFSNLLRKTLQNSDLPQISLFEELNHLKLYLDLEKRRFPDRFVFNFNINSSLDLHNLEVPPMLFQPFLENSILHGILPSDDFGKIDLNIWEEQNFIHIEIIDNGIGKVKSHSNHDSKGIEITKRRIELMHHNNTIVTKNRVDYDGKSGFYVKITLYIQEMEL